MDTISYKAVPMITKSRDGQAPSVQPAIIVNDTPVQSIGAVDFRKPLNVANAGVPTDITIRFANATGATVRYIFGDANGLIAAIQGVVYVKPSAPASSIDAVVSTIGKNPTIIRSINYRITTGNSGQFSERFQFADADMDGSLQIKPLNIQSAQRNTQQNDKILTLAQEIPMDDTTGIILDVAANTTVELDLSFLSIYRSGANF